MAWMMASPSSSTTHTDLQRLVSVGVERVVVVDVVLAGARLDVHFIRYAEARTSSTCVDGVVAGVVSALVCIFVVVLRSAV
jgi:hypothetical protein